MATGLPEFHSGQNDAQRVINANRFSVLRCGRRFGKTTLLESNAIFRSLFPHMAQRVGWFAPTYKLTTPIYKDVLSIVPSAAVKTASRLDGLIEFNSGGGIEFWTLENENAGRSRSYDLALIDEASLVVGLKDIFEKSIKPTLLDRAGRAVMAGTPQGIDPDNYFYAACTQGDTGDGTKWAEFYAPTSANPHLNAEDVARLKAENTPLVYQQEYLAQFVDWRGASFFSLDLLLDDESPAEDVTQCTTIFATVDTAYKGGEDHDATAVTYWALCGKDLRVLDWDVVRIDSDLLSHWIGGVADRLVELSHTARPLRGVRGVFIEDKASGTTLLQAFSRTATRVRTEALPARMAALGKDGRAIDASQYVTQNRVKICESAYAKQTNFNGVTANHLVSQVTGYRVGMKTPHAMDLLDTFTYGVLLGLAPEDDYV